MVVSLHPGVTKDQVIEATGWDIRFADILATTDLPTQNEIDVLRELKRVTEEAHSQSENAQ
jgi:glutaconate CoA-transferase subunit B